jgi:hypothetical protein
MKRELDLIKASPYILIILICLFAFRSVYAAENVTEILKSVEANAAPPNERVELKMVIQESDGTQKVRELSIIRKSEGGGRALIRLSKPSDLKGLSLLTVSNGDKEEQYLYLPSDKKSRRILGSSKRGKFLDSEIAYEDLALSTYKDFNNKIVKSTPTMVQIESKAKPDSESSYGKVMTWILKPDYKIDHVDYFDKSGKILKRAQFKNYQKEGDKFWRARTVLVVNAQNKRKTQLQVKKVSLKKIADDEVSLSALEE